MKMNIKIVLNMMIIVFAILFLLSANSKVYAVLYIDSSNITVIAHSSYGSYSPSLTADESGLDYYGIHHSVLQNDTWLSAQLPIGTSNASPAGTTGTAWIAFYFDKVYSLGDMWVWNYNVAGATTRGFRNVWIYYRDSGSNWQYWGEYEFAPADGTASYTVKDILDLNGVYADAITIVAQPTQGNWGAGYIGLSEVKFYIDHPEIDMQSDKWIATDALGRKLPGYAQCGSARSDKYVGMFYFLWLGQHGTGGPYDITKIIAADPVNPVFGTMGAYHHWGESEMGYYLSDDEYVIRKHAQMLSNAGVDVIIFDVTNGYTYQDNYMTLCSVFEQIRSEGGITPQIAFLCPFWSPNGVVESLYNNFYAPGYYSDLWFYWKGKPLIMADPDLISNPTIKSFFTCRKPQPSYFDGPGGINWWGWLEVYPQHYFYETYGTPEQVVVGVAQNSWSGNLTQMSDARGATGRSWHDGYKDTAADAVDFGYNFAEQWQRALELDPEFIFITSWNEWVAYRMTESGNNPSYYPDAVFWDVYDQEYSRDIEPMKNGHTDNYYYQMVDYIRQFKGVDPSPVPSGKVAIIIDGDFSDWFDIMPQYRDNINDTISRNSVGWGTGVYINTTGRNDFVTLKVARDNDYIYFYAETADNITNYTDPNWMLLFIDTDQDYNTGWQGYDYLVNYNVVDSDTTTLMQTSSGWNWTTVNSDIDYNVLDNKLELRIPRSDIGQDADDVIFDFHWADNIQQTDDIIEFAVSGDSAPNRRFNYRYDTSLTQKACDNLFDSGLGEQLDLDENCYINFEDLLLLTDSWVNSYDFVDYSQLAENWLVDYTPQTFDADIMLSDDAEGDMSSWLSPTSWTQTQTYSYSPSSSLFCQDCGDNLVSQPIDLTGKVSFKLSFRYRTGSGLTSYDNTLLQFYNGISYETIIELSDYEQNVWRYYTVTVYNQGVASQYFINDFNFRIEGTGIDFNGEYICIDDVKLIATE